MVDKFQRVRNIILDIESFLDGDWELFPDVRDEMIPDLQEAIDIINADDIADEFDLTTKEVLDTLDN